MKKFKRLIALVTVAMFLLSFVAPAMAATQDQMDAFSRLKGLSVAVGDANGDPLYDKTFTRAEAAAVMVNLSGMKAAIDSAKGATKFKDVPASHWASGVINLAVGAGIIKGYPDGTYKPDKEVSYAEMSAMLVGVLGYTPKLQGTWPSNVIGKAAQLGLLDGVSVDSYNAAAVRANVFLAADNALDVKPLKETNDGWVEDTDVLMVKKLNVTKRTEGIVTSVPNISGGDKHKITIDPDTTKANDEYTVTLVDSLDANAYLGLKVVPWEKDDKVFFLNVKTNATDTFTDKIAKIDGGTTALDPTANFTVKLDAKDKTYTVVYSGSTLYRNFAAFSGSNKLAVGDSVKVVLDGTGKIKHLEATSYEQGIVKSVNTTDEKIVLDQTTSAGSLNLKNLAATIVKNGSIVDLAAVKEGDVVSYIINSNIAYVYVSDKTVQGTVKSVGWNGDYSFFKVTIDNTLYPTPGGKDVWKSTDDGKNYNTITNGSAGMSDFNSFFNKKVTAKLNAKGELVSATVGSAENANEIPVLVKEIKRDTSGVESNKTYLRVTKFDGTNAYFEVTKNTKLNDWTVIEADLVTPAVNNGHSGSVAVGDIVKITLDSTGNKISTIKDYSSDYAKDTDGIALNKDNDTIVLGAGDGTGTTYKVTTDTKVLKVKSYITTNIDDVENATWSSIEGLSATQLTNVDVAYVKDGGVIKYLVILSDNSAIPNLGSDYYYGISTGSGVDIDGDYTTFDVNGESKTFHSGRIAKGELVEFKINTDTPPKYTDSTVFTTTYAMNENKTVTGSTYTWFKIKSIDKTNNIIEAYAAEDVDETNLKSTVVYILVGSSTVYYNDDSVKITINDLSKDDMIQVYDVLNKDDNSVIQGATADGIVDFVKITKP